MRMIAVWTAAFLILAVYYAGFQCPMEREFAEAVILERGHNYDEAIADFKKILSLYPAYPPAYLNLAYIYGQLGLTKLSKDNAQMALKNAIITSEDLTQRGLVYYGKRIRFYQINRYNRFIIRNYFVSVLSGKVLDEC